MFFISELQGSRSSVLTCQKKSQKLSRGNFPAENFPEENFPGENFPAENSPGKTFQGKIFQGKTFQGKTFYFPGGKQGWNTLCFPRS